MPNINSIPEVLYEPNQPYHYIYDNLPLKNILTRIGLVNIQVDTTADALRGAAGDAGTIGNRLAVSLEQDGSLKSVAIDLARHGIGNHVDGQGPDGIEYVKMMADERAKLALIQDGANSLSVEIDDQSSLLGDTVTISSGVLKLRKSSSVFFEFEAPNTVRLHSTFPPDVAHRHHYSLEPAPQNSPADFRNFKTTSYATAYMEGTLRVYVNGVRLFRSAVPVPGPSGTPFSPTYITSESPLEGIFSLNRTLSEFDVIRIDFDEAFFLPSISGASSSSSS